MPAAALVTPCNSCAVCRCAHVIVRVILMLEHTSRRTFLKDLSLAGAAALIPDAPRAFARVGWKQQIGIELNAVRDLAI